MIEDSSFTQDITIIYSLLVYSYPLSGFLKIYFFPFIKYSKVKFFYQIKEGLPESDSKFNYISIIEIIHCKSFRLRKIEAY